MTWGCRKLELFACNVNAKLLKSLTVLSCCNNAKMSTKKDFQSGGQPQLYAFCACQSLSNVPRDHDVEEKVRLALAFELVEVSGALLHSVWLCR
jgi:hypothetical protein